jgi:hypothetical protein
LSSRLTEDANGLVVIDALDGQSGGSSATTCAHDVGICFVEQHPGRAPTRREKAAPWTNGGPTQPRTIEYWT